MLVAEYNRMEAEDAAWTGLRVAGMVMAAAAALGGLAVVVGLSTRRSLDPKFQILNV
jgi:hypothetical protein